MGGSPEYWSAEQGSMFNNIKDRAKEGSYVQSVKLLPTLTNKSDLYQLGLILAELLFSKRMWARGDKISYGIIQSNLEESHCNKETANFVFEKMMELISPRPEERKPLYDLIP